MDSQYFDDLFNQLKSDLEKQLEQKINNSFNQLKETEATNDKRFKYEFSAN